MPKTITYKMISNWSMISPVVNDNHLYVNIGGGEGPPRSGNHQHENNKALEIVDESRDLWKFPIMKVIILDTF
jgi:hypothetical protein